MQFRQFAAASIRILCSALGAFAALACLGLASLEPATVVAVLVIGGIHWASLIGVRESIYWHYKIPSVVGACPTKQAVIGMAVGFLGVSFAIGLIASLMLGHTLGIAAAFAGIFTVLGMVGALGSNIFTNLFPKAKTDNN